MAVAVAAAAAAVASVRRRIAYMKRMAMKHMETNIDQASGYIQSGDIDNPGVYSKTCMKLGSTIDAAITMNAIPSSSHLSQLLSIVKEVYRHKTELLQPSLMLLMLPIKAACQLGWFSDGDKDDLLIIAKEVSYGFSDTDKMSIEPSYAHSCVSNIISRFYPTMKVEHILASFDVKAGYGTFVADFHISLGTTPRCCRSLWLLVARMDNMDTAACIASPSNVDFLINGNEVPKRTKNDMGKGPQLPSNITKMIKYGVNLLQVFGDFDGQYIITVAFMNSISSPDPSQLQDYLHPVSRGDDSDCDVIEMSSRISLDCPLGQHRIKTPVKGHLCKHPQCFDYNYYMEINSTRPTWKCPLCKKPVCNQDIRIDQDFLKILNEVAEDVNDVIVSEDSSWIVAETNRDTMNQAAVKTPAVSPGQTQVNVCTTNQAQGATMLTPPSTVTKSAVSPGQTQVNVCTTTQAESTTIFTPPSTVISPAVSPGQTQVNVCTSKQAQSRTMLSPPATVITPSVSPGQTQVKVCTIKQAQSTTLFTPPSAVTKPTVSPGQTQVNVCTTKKARSTTMFTPPSTVITPAVSPGQTQVNVCTTKQAQSRTMFTLPAVSPGQTQVNVCTTKQAQSTTKFTPAATGESKPASKISLASPTQLLEASGDAMPSGRMRGSLKGDRLEAARLQFLAPPRQSARANEPWSRPPTPSFPLAFLTRQPPTNSENESNSNNLTN